MSEVQVLKISQRLLMKNSCLISNDIVILCSETLGFLPLPKNSAVKFCLSV